MWVRVQLMIYTTSNVWKLYQNLFILSARALMSRLTTSCRIKPWKTCRKYEISAKYLVAMVTLIALSAIYDFALSANLRFCTQCKLTINLLSANQIAEIFIVMIIKLKKISLAEKFTVWCHRCTYFLSDCPLIDNKN